MIFFKRTSQEITVGSRLVRSGEPHSAVWVVKEVVETVPGCPHARLVKEARPSDRITVALTVVSDRRHFSPAPAGLAAAE